MSETKADCPFCNPDVVKQQMFHKTKSFYCFYNIKPVLPGHSMIIPKTHTESLLDLSDKEMSELAKLMKETSAVLMEAYGGKGVDLSLQNGILAGASIAHIHMHVVPRRANDIEGDPSLWFAKIVEAERTREPISATEVKENIKRIKAVIKKRKQAARKAKAETKSAKNAPSSNGTRTPELPPQTLEEAVDKAADGNAIIGG